jgi:hypothetical protein
MLEQNKGLLEGWGRAPETGWMGPYAVCFGLGLIILLVVLMLGLSKAADGTKVSGHQMLAA